ncbi:MAG: hypothetical protein ABI569_03665 [Casimicrobiaceae bacterium]
MSPTPFVAAFVAAALASFGQSVAAETIGGNPGPAHNYVCPAADGMAALDCYFDAVGHLYTMCKHVKSIEVIEFGYEKSTEGVHGAKSEYCLNKQKLNMTRPYQGALRDASISKQAVEGVRSLQEYWLTAMAGLAWQAGESDEAYKARTLEPYDRFKERIAGIKEILVIVKSHTTPAPAAPAAKGKAKR